MPGTSTAVVFHGRAYISSSANTEHSLVIDMDPMVMAQVIIEPTVAFIWTFLVNLFNLVRKEFILRGSPAQFSRSPFVVSRASHMEQFTGQFNGIVLFGVCFSDGSIDMALSYFRKASLLSISSIFLAGHASFLPDTAYA